MTIYMQVRVVYDYTRKPKDEKNPEKAVPEKALPEKAYHSVYSNDVYVFAFLLFHRISPLQRNIAVFLVENGLAWVSPPRAGEERSLDFELLLIAENKAKAARKGLHGYKSCSFLIFVALLLLILAQTHRQSSSKKVQ